MPDAPPSPPLLEGTVMRSTGSWYDVKTPADTIRCRVRGKFRLAETGTTNPVIVGDRVSVRPLDDGTGLIVDIHPRRTKLSRRAAGRRVGLEHILAVNIDAAWTVHSVRQPRINPGFIDRFLVMAEVNEIQAGLVINKSDLIGKREAEPVRFWRDLYAGLGYPVLLTSTVTGEGIEAFAGELRDRISVVAGPSGTGKSSLLNAVAPGLNLRTGEVSRKTRKGKHTTTFAALHPLPGGGFVVDTPGLREYGIIELEPAMLSHYFVEFRPYLPHCRYPDCTHDHEPGCAVQEAVEAGDITPERFMSYLNILASLHLGERDVGR